MATEIKIGHASISEHGTVNGNPGDSTGKEVYMRENYPIGSRFNLVLRPKSKILAERSAKACEDACNNDNIGYSQDSRNSLYTEASKVDYEIAKITTPCNTDCSAFMTLCAIAGGATFSYGLDNSNNAPTCGSMERWFTSKGEYEVLKDTEYIRKTDYLKRGDILVDESAHTVMVLENGCQITDSSDIKIALTLSDIKTTAASAIIIASKIENGEENPLTDTQYADLYEWTYRITSLNDTEEHFTKQLPPLNAEGSAKISLTGLRPYRSYILKVIAKEYSGEAEISSASIPFTTLQEYPGGVKWLKVKFNNLASTSPSCNITFEKPSRWCSTDAYTKGYRIYFILNGRLTEFKDIGVNTENGVVSETVLLKDIAPNTTFTATDTLQIGVLPWIKDTDNNIIFNRDSLKCSQPFYNKHNLKSISKTFIKVNDSFKHALAHYS